MFICSYMHALYGVLWHRWGHDQKNSTVAANGNPKPCGQGSCNDRDWGSNSWAPDIVLSSCNWSTAGFYRGGGAIGFDGVRSRGVIASSAAVDSLRDGLTIGLVVHPSGTGGAQTVLWSKPGVFELSLNASGVLVWTVQTSAGVGGVQQHMMALRKCSGGRGPSSATSASQSKT